MSAYKLDYSEFTELCSLLNNRGDGIISLTVSFKREPSKTFEIAKRFGFVSDDDPHFCGDPKCPLSRTQTVCVVELNSKSKKQKSKDFDQLIEKAKSIASNKYATG